MQNNTADSSNATLSDSIVTFNQDGSVIVGSGITLSPDGDVFTTGVTTSSSFVGDLTGDVTGTASNATQLNSQAASYYLDYDNFSNTPTIPSNNNQLTNGAGFITASDDITGNAATSTKLATARTIAGVSFDGSANISLNNNAITNGAGYITTSFTNTNQLTNGAGFITASDDITGNAATATTLETARNIGGVSFNGSSNIDLPGVNSDGNQDTTGNAATATALETARNIGGVSFDGSANIDLPGVNSAGNQNTTGTSAGLTGTPSITVNAVNGATGTFSGNVTIGGVLTYEDVTNVDSIGVITARSGVLVGTGVTLSPDGDIFSVGFSTIGNGSSGGFELYHQGVKRVSSQSYGAFIHGALVSSNDIKVGSYVGKLIAGTSNEFTIQHDNANTLVNNTVGILSITSSNNVAITTNFSVAGVSTFSDNVRIIDNKSLLLGDHADGDLSILHDGNNGNIRTRTGSLYFLNASQNQLILVGSTGAVKAYHGGNLKFETTSSGVTVTGTAVATSFTGDLTGDVTGNADTATTLATARNMVEYLLMVLQILIFLA